MNSIQHPIQIKNKYFHSIQSHCRPACSNCPSRDSKRQGSQLEHYETLTKTLLKPCTAIQRSVYSFLCSSMACLKLGISIRCHVATDVPYLFPNPIIPQIFALLTNGRTKKQLRVPTPLDDLPPSNLVNM